MSLHQLNAPGITPLLRPLYTAAVVPVVDAFVAVVDAVKVAFGIPFADAGTPEVSETVQPASADAPAASSQMTPNDTLYSSQWHFPLIGDVETVWEDYSGAGVEVAVYDDGVETAHPDLNYDPQNRQFESYSPEPINSNASHGTAVSGLIAATGNNNLGVIGGAHEAIVTGVNFLDVIQYDGSAATLSSFEWAGNFDLMNNSWGLTPNYGSYQNILNDNAENAVFETISETGRDGLGTIIVQASGNDDVNANGDSTNGSRFTASIAATASTGNAASYTNWGSGILVAAPAGAVTTDITGSGGYSSSGDYTTGFGGTSAATPVTSGVIGLMLEANPDLGWRDVHNILAESAQLTGSDYGGSALNVEHSQWGHNGASTWNGGGHAFNLSYGYGMVDALAAVRMAEVWHDMHGAARTSANEVTTLADYTGSSVAIPEVGTATVAVNVATNIEIETALVIVDITHSYSSDLEIALISPDGAVIPMFVNETNASGSTGFMASGFRWQFEVTALRGVESEGDWTLRVVDSEQDDSGTINDFSVTFFGAPVTDDDVHTITEDFATLAAVDAERSTLSDDAGDHDWVNLVGVAGDVDIDLAGDLSLNGASAATLDGSIENAALGDGNDEVIGTNGLNTLLGGRGNDVLNGLNGTDTLNGQAGDDDLNGGDGILLGDIGAKISRLYSASLDRNPDQPGYFYWSEELENGAPLTDLATAFINSDEFQEKYGNVDNTGFVTLLYQNVLDREPDTDGLSYWVGQLDGGETRENVLIGFSESAEYIATPTTVMREESFATQDLYQDAIGKTYRIYQATLDREPDQEGFEYWTDQLSSGQSVSDVISSFLSSPEFTSKYGDTTNGEFVTLLYQNVLDREPDQGGYDYWVGELDSGTTRDDVVVGFAESDEFKAALAPTLNDYMQANFSWWQDTISGGSGSNNLAGGRGSDMFIFEQSDGSQNIVYGLDSWDQVTFNGFSYSIATDATDNMSQQDSDVLFSDQGVTIQFVETSLSTLIDLDYTFA